MRKLPVFLDYNSTTPVDPLVLEKMLPYFTEKFGNAASKTHSFGWVADDAVDYARTQVADLIGSEKEEIIFTSGATEAINMALKGTFENFSFKGNHIITVKTEHKAVLDTCSYLERKGARITYLDVDREGIFDLDELTAAITASTILVCTMFANNETGVIQPIEKIGKICRDKSVFFFCDATQAAGKTRLDVNEQCIDMMCISAHKLYGPKGVGALYLRRRNPRATLTPLIHGGGHERGFRSGTLNVTGIVGFGTACELAQKNMWEEGTRISRLRAILEQTIINSPSFSELIGIESVFINGSIKNRLNNTSNICFKNILSADFLKKITDVAVATGSACSSANPAPSHVLKAMGLTDEEAGSSIRFSLGRFTTEEEIQFVIEKITSIGH